MELTQLPIDLNVEFEIVDGPRPKSGGGGAPWSGDSGFGDDRVSTMTSRGSDEVVYDDPDELRDESWSADDGSIYESVADYQVRLRAACECVRSE
jgi:hypothetical protein